MGVERGNADGGGVEEAATCTCLRRVQRGALSVELAFAHPCLCGHQIRDGTLSPRQAGQALVLAAVDLSHAAVTE